MRGPIDDRAVEFWVVAGATGGDPALSVQILRSFQQKGSGRMDKTVASSGAGPAGLAVAAGGPEPGMAALLVDQGNAHADAVPARGDVVGNKGADGCGCGPAGSAGASKVSECH